jgi:hypothetical protein
MSRNTYSIGEMFLDGLRNNSRTENDMGRIVIGGDRADVHAASAYMDTQDGEDGVVLVDVDLKTTLEWDDLSEDELRSEALEVINFCYVSIQEDTFNKTKSAE